MVHEAIGGCPGGVTLLQSMAGSTAAVASPPNCFPTRSLGSACRDDQYCHLNGDCRLAKNDSLVEPGKNELRKTRLCSLDCGLYLSSTRVFVNVTPVDDIVTSRHAQLGTRVI